MVYPPSCGLNGVWKGDEHPLRLRSFGVWPSFTFIFTQHDTFAVDDWDKILSSKSFKVLTEPSRRSFHCAANAFIWQICNWRRCSAPVANEMYCIPILLYGLEACPLRKNDLSSLDFVVNSFFMKLFQTNYMDVIKSCQSYFSFQLPSAVLRKCVEKFNMKFIKNHQSQLCRMINNLWSYCDV